MLNTPNETKLTFKIESIFSRWIFVCAILTCKLVVLVVRSEKVRKNKILSNERWYLKETLFSSSRSINLPWMDVLLGVGEIIYIELYQRSAPVMHNVNESCQSVLDSVLEKLEGKLAAFWNPPWRRSYFLCRTLWHKRLQVRWDFSQKFMCHIRSALTTYYQGDNSRLIGVSVTSLNEFSINRINY